jgi:hypothetical protein
MFRHDGIAWKRGRRDQTMPELVARMRMGWLAGRNSVGADFPRAEDMAHHSLVQAKKSG